MDKSEIETRVHQIVSRILNVEPAAIGPESDFEALGADSLHRVELAMALEESFGLEVSEETARQLTSLRAVVDHVYRHAGLR